MLASAGESYRLAHRRLLVPDALHERRKPQHTARLSTVQSSPDSEETKLFRDISAYRAAHGVPALTFSHGLARPAMWGSIDSANRGFSPSNHVDSRGMGVADRARFCSGYVGWVGEISFYGWGSQEAGSRTSALRWWKGSPGHNALLLSRDYTTMSVGRAYIGVNAEVRQHWTVMFGRA